MCPYTPSDHTKPSPSPPTSSVSSEALFADRQLQIPSWHAFHYKLFSSDNMTHDGSLEPSQELQMPSAASSDVGDSDSNVGEPWNVLDRQSWETESEPVDDSASSTGLETPEASPALHARHFSDEDLLIDVQDLTPGQASVPHNISSTPDLEPHDPVTLETRLVIFPIMTAVGGQTSLPEHTTQTDTSEGNSPSLASTIRLPRASNPSDRPTSSTLEAAPTLPTITLSDSEHCIFPNPLKIEYHGPGDQRDKIIERVAEMVKACAKSAGTENISGPIKHYIIPEMGHPRGVSLIPAAFGIALQECDLHTAAQDSTKSPVSFGVDAAQHEKTFGGIQHSMMDHSTSDAPHLILIVTDKLFNDICLSKTSNIAAPVYVLLPKAENSCSVNASPDPVGNRHVINLDSFFDSDTLVLGKSVSGFIAYWQSKGFADPVKPPQSQMLHSTIVKAWRNIGESTSLQAVKSKALWSRKISEAAAMTTEAKGQMRDLLAKLNSMILPLHDQTPGRVFAAFCLTLLASLLLLPLMQFVFATSSRSPMVGNTSLATVLSRTTPSLGPRIMLTATELTETRLVDSIAVQTSATTAASVATAQSKALASVISGDISSRFAGVAKILGQRPPRAQKPSPPSSSDRTAAVALSSTESAFTPRSRYSKIPNVTLEAIPDRDCAILQVPQSRHWKESNIVVHAHRDGRAVSSTLKSLRPQVYLIEVDAGVQSGAVQILVSTKVLPTTTFAATVQASYARRLLTPLGSRLGLSNSTLEHEEILNSTLATPSSNFTSHRDYTWVTARGSSSLRHGISSLQTSSAAWLQQTRGYLNMRNVTLGDFYANGLSAVKKGANTFKHIFDGRTTSKALDGFNASNGTPSISSIWESMGRLMNSSVESLSLQSEWYRKSLELPAAIKAPLTKARARVFAIGRSMQKIGPTKMLPKADEQVKTAQGIAKGIAERVRNINKASEELAQDMARKLHAGANRALCKFLTFKAKGSTSSRTEKLFGAGKKRRGERGFKKARRI